MPKTPECLPESSREKSAIFAELEQDAKTVQFMDQYARLMDTFGGYRGFPLPEQYSGAQYFPPTLRGSPDEGAEGRHYFAGGGSAVARDGWARCVMHAYCEHLYNL